MRHHRKSRNRLNHPFVNGLLAHVVDGEQLVAIPE